MWPRLMHFLSSPHGGGPLELAPLEINPTGDIRSGLLRCPASGATWPIVRGIPRIFPDAWERSPTFARRFRDAAASRAADIGAFQRDHGLTRRAFGYEWRTFKTTSWEEDVATAFWLTGLDPGLYDRLPAGDIFTFYPTPEQVARIEGSHVRGRTLLDVGCGMGKYVRVFASYGAEVIGLDLSEAIDRAADELRGLPNVHLVQADILSSPIRPASADIAFSVGVLHHTPDCRAAFRRAGEAVRPGGRLAVWLYPKLPPGRYGWSIRDFQDRVLRPITCRMSPPALYRLSCLLGGLTFVRDRWARRGPVGRVIARACSILAVGRHRDPEIAAFLNFEWYSPRFRSYHTSGELRTWFAEEGFAEVRLLPQPVSAIGVKRLA